MSIQAGEVISVRGVQIIVKVFESSNKDTLFYDGVEYKGVSIGEHIIIQRGFRDIVCMIEGEYLDENRVEQENNKIIYVRKVEAKPIGYFETGQFNEGIKYLPMIKDLVFLASEAQIKSIYERELQQDFIIGKMLKDELLISLPWNRLFNSHLGIFGNTGSGKSNTLTKLYTVLFEQKKDQIKGKSQFIILDFNGEYTNEQLIADDEHQNKKVYNLSTKKDNGDKFPLAATEFWNAETLSILFKATQNTQKPFLNRVVEGYKKYSKYQDSLLNWIKATFKSAFTTTSPKKEYADLLIKVSKIIDNNSLTLCLQQLHWHNAHNKFMHPSLIYGLNGKECEYETVFAASIKETECDDLDYFDILLVRSYLQLTNDLLSGYVQFDHISPLLSRMDASISALKQVITVGDSAKDYELLTVISLRECNQDTKKILPLLFAKHYYESHKSDVENPPNKTMHLIIDEAHNILSEQSKREEESWKDYRLEMFEEIIKEGRKFGMFLTISSQRPADISPTIISQLHNFFIHRLVNERDLFLLNNTISTLDALSYSMIPNLSKGCCIATGTAFNLPLLLQVDFLKQEHRPDSDDVDLNELWG